MCVTNGRRAILLSANFTLQVTAVPLDSYCNDRSAEYERGVLKEGGSLAAKQCLLNGAPELATDWLSRRSQFFPEPAGGLLSIRPQNGWSFIRIPGEFSALWSMFPALTRGERGRKPM
jgi:DNA helicase INO80